MGTTRARSAAQPKTSSPDRSEPSATKPAPEPLTWGRRSGAYRSWTQSVMSGSPVWLAPLTIWIMYTTMVHFEGSFALLFAAFRKHGVVRTLWDFGPRCSLDTSLVFAAWIALQTVLYVFLPASIHTGQETPAGHVLDYRINGLLAWVVTYGLLAVLDLAGVIDLGYVVKNWSGWFAAMNIAGFALSLFAHVKANLAPTHPDDVKFTNSTLYNFYMGVELNPRIGNDFDFKIFTNGHIGMMTWTLINVSNIVYQYRTFGTVSMSLILVSILHNIYILDFFVNEKWYLRTIDIAHDHYGYYLAWGCFAWLPMTYTLQAQYLGLYPTYPSPIYLGVTFAIGILGYCLFRSVNDQKDNVRRSNGKCMIWGKPAEYIRASYQTSDGATHESLLLTSGWWGFSRHCNYVGDLFLSTAMCALVGTSKVLVWFYAVYMAGLLIHRCLRDEKRCRAKYGKQWDEYCKTVPWRLVPGIW